MKWELSSKDTARHSCFSGWLWLAQPSSSPRSDASLYEISEPLDNMWVIKSSGSKLWFLRVRDRLRTHSSPILIHSMCILNQNRRDSLEVNYLIHHPVIHKWWDSGILLSGGNVLNRAGKIARWIKSGETRLLLLRMSVTQAWGPELGSQLQD